MNKISKYPFAGKIGPSAVILMKRLHYYYCLFTSALMVFMVDAWGQTNNYFGSTGTLTNSVWSTNPAGPYTSPLNASGGAILNFGNMATVTGATITVTGINATADVTSWVGGGTLSTGGTIATINVSPGVTLNMFSQGISTAAGTGFIKTGAGALAMSTGSAYTGGFTLNNGTIVIGGINALGNNTLTLNGGIVAADGNMNLNGKYPGGIGIGGDVQFGDITTLASNTANLSFNNNISLGAIHHLLTLGNAATISLGCIMGGSNGISFTSNANGSGCFDITNIANTFTGTINLLGGRTRFAADGSFGNAANTIVIDGGQLLNSTTFSIAATHHVKLGTSMGTGITVASGSLTMDAMIADKTSNGSFTKFGLGTLILNSANTYSGTTYIDATGGTLQLNRPGGGTLPAGNNIVQAGGVLKISSDQTLNDISLIGGNITVENAATLTINGTFEYFQPGTITLIGGSKIMYGPSGKLKYSGTISTTISAVELPVMNGPQDLEINNSGGVLLPGNRTINGSLVLSNGVFTIGANTLLDLDGAAVSASSGYLAATNTSDLIIQGTTGGTVNLPTNANISLRHLTVIGTRTLAMNGLYNLNLNGNLTIGTTATFDNGGESQVINGGGAINISGTFITKDKDGFTGTNASIPSIYPALNAGCTIEYGLATGNPQDVTARNDYQNIKFSGSGVKTLSSGFNPTGTVYITGNAVVNAASHTFGNGATNLTMDGGRLILSGTNNPQPHMSGTYQLTGGVVEFACNSISGQTIRTQTYQNIEVSGGYVGNSLGNITLNANGTFTVKTGGVFEINDDGITGPFGSSETVTLETGATFKTGDKDGFSGGIGSTATSINQTIENIVLAPGSTVDYSRNDIQNITNGIPYQNLTISGNMGVKTAPAGSLTINGNLLKTGSSSFAHNNGNVNFINTTAIQHFTNTGATAVNFYDFTNSNSFGTGLNILNDLGIVNRFNLSANSQLNLVSGNIGLLSTATGTAMVSAVPSTAAIDYGTGRFNVARYFPGDRSWRLITSPLSALGTSGTIFSNWQNNGIYSVGIGTLVTGKNPGAGNGLDDSFFDNYSMKKFENNIYVNVDNTLVPLSNGNSLTADNIGYFMFVRGDRNPLNTIFPNTNNTTLNSRGKLQTGQQTMQGLPRTGVGRYFGLVGNPYASPVNFNSLTRVNLVKRFVVWDPKINQVGAFVVFDDIDNDGNYSQSAPSPGGQDLNIQSGQAFIVETDAVAGPSSLIFAESNKTTSQNSGMFKPVQPATSLASFRSSLNLFYADNTTKLADGNLAEFKAGYNDALDFQDALKFDNLNENFSLVRNQIMVGIERRPEIIEGDTLYFRLSNTTKRNYQLYFEPNQLNPLLNAVLEDSYTGLTTPVSVTQPGYYNFAVNGDAASSAANRFRMVFKLAATGPLPVSFKSIYARLQAGQIAVEWTVENELNIKQYEVEKSTDGVNFVKVITMAACGTNSISSRYNWLDETVAGGNHFYRVRSIGVDGKMNFSNTVLVKMDHEFSGIRIIPNPVAGDLIKVKFYNLPAGEYQVRMLTAQGRVLVRKKIHYQSGDGPEKIIPGFKLTSGVYLLQFTSPNHPVILCNLIVQ
jgi:autotransporter-associated beta strand protein